MINLRFPGLSLSKYFLDRTETGHPHQNTGKNHITLSYIVFRMAQSEPSSGVKGKAIYNNSNSDQAVRAVHSCNSWLLYFGDIAGLCKER